MVRLFSALVLALALAPAARAEVDAVSWNPGAQVAGFSPELVVAYSVGNNNPRYDFITLEIKQGNSVIAGDLIVIDSQAPVEDVSFGAYQLPAGDYTAIVHCGGNSAVLPFTVTAPAQPPGPPHK